MQDGHRVESNLHGKEFRHDGAHAWARMVGMECMHEARCIQLVAILLIGCMQLRATCFAPQIDLAGHIM